MKNWSPSLVKNLEPFTEIVGIPSTAAEEMAAASTVMVAGRMLEFEYDEGRCDAESVNGEKNY
jgi:hypothetical protein